MLTKLAESDLLALWKPKKDQFFHADMLPYLSGAVSWALRALKTQVAELAGTPTLMHASVYALIPKMESRFPLRFFTSDTS